MRNHWRIYAVLIAVRLFIASTSFGTIHPDEYFQNPEIATRIVFDYTNSGGEPVQTWEWTGKAPCRSIAPLWLSSSLAFSLVRASIGNSEYLDLSRGILSADN
jgi:hypothetical protein